MTNTTNTITLTTALARYHQHRQSAKQRHIPFRLTFDEWIELWRPYWHQRGRRRHEYCMCRNDDMGSYKAGNVSIKTNSENHRTQFPTNARVTQTPAGMFMSATVAAEHHGLHRTTAAWRARNRRLGWSYVDEGDDADA